MLRYIIKRLFFFVPTLILISIVSFLLSKMAPGDPVLSYMELDGEDTQVDINNEVFKKEYEKMYTFLKLDQPFFYFKISPQNYPIVEPVFYDHRYKKLYHDYLDQHAESTPVLIYIQSLKVFEHSINEQRLSGVQHEFNLFLKRTSLSESKQSLKSFFDNIGDELIDVNIQQQLFVQLDEIIAQTYLIALPRFEWVGFENQYHHWIRSFFKEDRNRSLSDGEPVWDKIQVSIKWTFLMIFPALLISFILSIFYGVYNATYPKSKVVKWGNIMNYFFFSTPVFWLATIVLVLLGKYSHIFGIGEFIKQSDPIYMHFPKMILPILVIVLHNVAYISRQMYHSMVNQSKSNYIQTAKSKGVKNHDVIWNHQFRNALLPMITLITATIPAAFSGSVVLELIFNIPGMGRLMYQSLLQMDWPVVFGVLLFLSFVSLIFMLLGDILYGFINPKIKFSDEK